MYKNIIKPKGISTPKLGGLFKNVSKDGVVFSNNKGKTNYEKENVSDDSCINETDSSSTFVKPCVKSLVYKPFKSPVLIKPLQEHSKKSESDNEMEMCFKVMYTKISTKKHKVYEV
jgi:hypothetical protein